MSSLNDGLAYLGESYWGLPNTKEGKFKELDKGNLYYKWGLEKGELLDYLECFKCFSALDLRDESNDLKFDIYQKMLDCLSEILRLRLKKAVEGFDFLCLQRPKIELRDLNFKKEVNDIVVEFIDFEKVYFENLDEIKSNLIAEDLEDDFKERRKNLLESAEVKMSEVEQAIQAFYHRIKVYVEEDSSKTSEEEE